MTSDAGLTSQDTDYARDIQEVLNELRQMERTPRLVTSALSQLNCRVGIRQSYCFV